MPGIIPPNTIVISHSELSTFKTCRKKYELGYVRNLEPLKTSDAVEQGTTIHRYLERAAREGPASIVEDDEMAQVAREYLAYKPLPEQIVGVEKPFFVPFLSGTYEVLLRCTFDLVYKVGNTYVIRDYKTFVKAPTLDLDLDFQSRLYIAALQKYFQTRNVHFEFEYIRQELGRQLKGGYTPWPIEDRYLNFPLVISNHQADRVWEEALWMGHDLIYTIEKKRFYRQDRKGFGGCSSCFYKELCKAENQLGQLDQQTIDLFAKPREEKAYA